MNYSIGDVLRCRMSNEYMLVTGITDNRILLHGLISRRSHMYDIVDVSNYFILL